VEIYMSCPVKTSENDGAGPKRADFPRGTPNVSAAACPMSGQSALQQEQATISRETYNPKVNDFFPDAKPLPDQPIPLSDKAVPSTIPKGGALSEEGETWVFPSPQRFYNALRKKGYDMQGQEADMDSIVKIHNTVNERAWAQVLEWESKYHSKCEPKLVKIRGRPTDLSPKARLNVFLGYTKPFDRHDWVIQRCDEEVRYVIDFYKGPVQEKTIKLEDGSFSRVQHESMYIDTRPELSARNSWDIIRNFFGV
jgi:cytochrome c heme-lyase